MRHLAHFNLFSKLMRYLHYKEFGAVDHLMQSVPCARVVEIVRSINTCCIGFHSKSIKAKCFITFFFHNCFYDLFCAMPLFGSTTASLLAWKQAELREKWLCCISVAITICLIQFCVEFHKQWISFCRVSKGTAFEFILSVALQCSLVAVMFQFYTKLSSAVCKIIPLKWF